MGNRWVAVACGLLGLTACGPSKLEAQRARMAQEQHARMAALDQVEARLLDDQGRVAYWTQLQERHSQVSAVACENAAEHVASMEQQEHKEHGKMVLKARRMAQFDGGHHEASLRESHD